MTYAPGPPARCWLCGSSARADCPNPLCPWQEPEAQAWLREQGRLPPLDGFVSSGEGGPRNVEELVGLNYREVVRRSNPGLAARLRRAQRALAAKRKAPGR